MVNVHSYAEFQGRIRTTFWLLQFTGWWFDLWKMMEFVSWDDDIPNIWKVIKIYKNHVPNHQPDSAFVNPKPHKAPHRRGDRSRHIESHLSVLRDPGALKKPMGSPHGYCSYRYNMFQVSSRDVNRYDQVCKYWSWSMFFCCVFFFRYMLYRFYDHLKHGWSGILMYIIF